jgi:hypothetical protein
MSHVYVLTNQHKQFLSKNSEWIDGRDSARLFRSEHKDIAINQMFEANTRNVNLRIELLQCPLDSKAQPQVPVESLGEPQGAGEVEPGSPQELPPETAPEVNPQPAPEVDPERAPEVDPDPQPEVTPEEPPEIRPGESERLLTWQLNRSS